MVRCNVQLAHTSETNMHMTMQFVESCDIVGHASILNGR